MARPLAVGDLNGSAAGVPPDEVLTGKGGDQLGIFGFAPVFPLNWANSSSRSVSGGLESAAFGDLDDDLDLDVLVGQTVNSTSARVNSIHYFKWDPAGSGGLEPATRSRNGSVESPRSRLGVWRTAGRAHKSRSRRPTCSTPGTHRGVPA